MFFLMVEFLMADLRSVFSCRTAGVFLLGVVFGDCETLGEETPVLVGCGVVRSMRYIDFLALLGVVSLSDVLEVASLKACFIGVFLDALLLGVNEVFSVPERLRELIFGEHVTFSLLRKADSIGVLYGVEAVDCSFVGVVNGSSLA